MCEVVDLGLLTSNGGHLKLSAIVVPHICDPICAQPVTLSKQSYAHLSTLDLADAADVQDSLEVYLLIESGQYWDLVTGKIEKGENGPLAIETKLGLVLSGPIKVDEVSSSVNLFFNSCSSHLLRVDTLLENETLECNLQRFWSLESLGILPEKETTLEQFVQQISFYKGRYEVCLPWKESHPPLTSNYELCHRRLNSLYKRLKQDPEHLREYDAVIKDQLSKGVIEVVQNPNGACGNRINYLPHHAVVRSDKDTTKLRIVYDASARDNGPSLNDYPSLGKTFWKSSSDFGFTM